jgi:hypothetical protein
MNKFLAVAVFTLCCQAHSADLHCFGWKGATSYSKSDEKVELKFSKSSNRPERNGEFTGESKNYRYTFSVGDISADKMMATGQAKISSKTNDIAAISPISSIQNNPKIDVNPILALQTSKSDGGNIGCKWE